MARQGYDLLLTPVTKRLASDVIRDREHSRRARRAPGRRRPRHATQWACARSKGPGPG